MVRFWGGGGYTDYKLSFDDERSLWSHEGPGVHVVGAHGADIVEQDKEGACK